MAVPPSVTLCCIRVTLQEETRRQLEVRWAYMEEQLPEGQQCEERVAYVENEKRVAAIEAENAKARAARRQAERDRIRRSKELRATAKLDAKLRTQIDELEVNAAALRAVLATLERLLAAERDVAELARSSCGSMMSSIDDDDDDDEAAPRKSAESFIRSEMELIRQQAKEAALQATSRTVETIDEAEEDAVEVAPAETSEAGADGADEGGASALDGTELAPEGASEA